MLKQFSKVAIAIILFSVVFSSITVEKANAQTEESFRIQLESILSKFKNYRYSNISVYQISDIRDFARAIREKEEAEMMGEMVTGEGDAECVSRVDRAITAIIEQQVQEGASLVATQRAIIMGNLTPPEQSELECVYNYFLSRITGPVARLRNAYVITTRRNANDIVPNTIIALVVTTKNELLHTNLNMPGPSNIYTLPELVAFELESVDYNAKNLYELVVNAFQQGMVIDRTLEAQGIGTLARFAPKKYGVTQSLISSEYDITASDIQKFIRISEAQPNNIVMKENELVVSADLISWRHYKPVVEHWEDGTTDTLSFNFNESLPQFGVELAYGNEAINYPSFWSERLTLSAVWDNVKLGLILPTNGWATLGQDLFANDRKLTHGSVGLAGTLNFPVRVIPKSGLFHLDFGYVFGDAEQSKYKSRKFDLTSWPIANTADSLDYLIRFSTQLHYTFGIAIDETYMIRFGLGGTVYLIESWYHDVSSWNEGLTNKLSFEKNKEEAVGGISAKIEFMATGSRTPFGGSIQYFDESLYGHVWLQIPIVDNTFALRLDGKMFTKALSNEPRIWENKGMFVPMARFIFNF